MITQFNHHKIWSMRAHLANDAIDKLISRNLFININSLTVQKLLYTYTSRNSINFIIENVLNL